MVAGGSKTVRPDGDLDRQLVERVQLGGLVLLGIMFVFIVADPIAGRTAGSALSAVHAARFALIALALLFLKRDPTQRRAVGVALFVTTIMCAGAVFAGVLAGGFVSAVLFCMSIAWATAALVPWGMAAQAVQVVIAIVSMISCVYLIYGDVLGPMLPRDLVTLVVGASFTIYIARVLEAERTMIRGRLADADRAESGVQAVEDLVGAMHRAESEFLGGRSLGPTLEVLMRSLLSLTHSELVCCVHQVRRQSEVVRTRIIGAMVADGADADHLRVQLGDLADSELAKALKQRESRIVVDCAKATIGVEFPGFSVRDCVVLPLIVDGEVLGALILANRPSGYDAQLLEYLEPFRSTGAQLADAFETEGKRRSAEREVHRLNASLERRVQERTAELEVANLELEAFSYSVSHDLRGPLRAISGFAELLIDEHGHAVSSEAKGYLDRIRNGATHMGRVIDDLLTLSRVTRRELEHENVDLAALARSALAELLEDQPGRTVEFVVADDLHVAGDRSLLRIALINLIENALKFTCDTEAARIEIGRKTDVRGEDVFFVADNGVGFDMLYVEKIFDAFERLHDVVAFPGSGIGLAIVDRIVSRHGGTVWAEGKVGGGAKFFFTLPAIVSS